MTDTLDDLLAILDLGEIDFTLRADEWLLYVRDSPAAFGARGFARGTLYARGGTPVASAAQEGLMRPVKEAEDRTQ